MRELIRVCNKYLIIITPATRSMREVEAQLDQVDPNLVFDHFHFSTKEQLLDWLGEEKVIQDCCHRSMLRFFDLVSDGASTSKAVWGLYRFVLDTCPGILEDAKGRLEENVREMVKEKTSLLKLLSGPN